MAHRCRWRLTQQPMTKATKAISVKTYENADFWDQLRMVAEALGYQGIKRHARSGLWGRSPDRPVDARPVRVARLTSSDALYALELWRQKHRDRWDIGRNSDGELYFITVGTRRACHQHLGMAVCIAILRHADVVE